MTKRSLTDDRGAVLMIVAIALPVLIGALVLAADVGHLMVERTKAQTAADATALATASQCGYRSRSYVDPATELIDENWPGAELVDWTGREWNARDATGLRHHCSVTVTVGSDVSTFFAGIFGVNEVRVERTATAEWEGPPGLALGVDSGVRLVD